MSSEVHEIIYKTNAEQLEQIRLKYLTLTEAERRGTSEKLKNDKLELESARQTTATIKEGLRIQTKEAISEKQKELLEFKSAEKLKLDSALATQREIRKSQSSALKQSAYLPTGTGLTGGLMGDAVQLGSMRATKMQVAYANQQLKEHEKALQDAANKHGFFQKSLTETLNSTSMMGLGVGIATEKLLEFGKESIMLAAKEEDLNSIVKISAQDMEDYKIASANMVSEAGIDKMVLYGLNIGKTKDEITLAIEQSRQEAKVTGDLEGSFRSIIKTSDGYMKSISNLNLSKLRYKEILNEEVQKLGGVVDATENANGEMVINIKNLNSQQETTVRSTAFNKLFAESFGDVSNKELTTTEKTQILNTAYEEMKTGIGQGLINRFTSLISILGTTGDKAKDTARAMDILKQAGRDLGSFMAGGFLGIAIDEISGLAGAFKNAAFNAAYLLGILQHIEGQAKRDIQLIPGTTKKDAQGVDMRPNLDNTQKHLDDLTKLYSASKDPEERAGLYKKMQEAQKDLDNLDLRPGQKSPKEKTDKTDVEDIFLKQIQMEIELAKELGGINEKFLNDEKAKLVVKRDELTEILKNPDLKDKEKLKYQTDLLGIQREINSIDKDNEAIWDKKIAQEQALRDARKQGLEELRQMNGEYQTFLKSLDDQLHENNISLIKNEFEQKQELIQETYRKEVENIDNLEKRIKEKAGSTDIMGVFFPNEISDEDKKRIAGLRQSATDKKTRSIEDLTDAWGMKMVNTFGGVLSESEQILNLFGASKSEVADIVKFLQSVLNTGMGIGSIIGDIVSLIPGVGGAAGAVIHAAEGGLGGGGNMVHLPMVGSGGMQRGNVTHVHLEGEWKDLVRFKNKMEKEASYGS